jgi:hypothetical protein
MYLKYHDLIISDVPQNTDDTIYKGDREIVLTDEAIEFQVSSIYFFVFLFEQV